MASGVASVTAQWMDRRLLWMMLCDNVQMSTTTLDGENELTAKQHVAVVLAGTLASFVFAVLRNLSTGPPTSLQTRRITWLRFRSSADWTTATQSLSDCTDTASRTLQPDNCWACRHVATLVWYWWSCIGCQHAATFSSNSPSWCTWPTLPVTPISSSCHRLHLADTTDYAVSKIRSKFRERERENTQGRRTFFLHVVFTALSAV